MLTMTPEAAAAVRDIRTANDFPDEAGLRITARLAGDEVSIDLGFAQRPEEGDEVLEESGARVFLDSETAGLLSEVELGLEEHGDHVHFQFTPRAESS